MKTTKNLRKVLPIVISVVFAMAVLIVAQVSASAAVIGKDIADLDSFSVGTGETGTYKGYQYEIVDIDGTNVAFITGYTGNETWLDMPDEINGYYVIGIGESAFEGNKNIKSVTLPQYCFSVDQCAFLDCTNLERIILLWKSTLLHGIMTVTTGLIMFCISMI